MDAERELRRELLRHDFRLYERMVLETVLLESVGRGRASAVIRWGTVAAAIGIKRCHLTEAAQELMRQRVLAMVHETGEYSIEPRPSVWLRTKRPRASGDLSRLDQGHTDLFAEPNLAVDVAKIAWEEQNFGSPADVGLLESEVSASRMTPKPQAGLEDFGLGSGEVSACRMTPKPQTGLEDFGPGDSDQVSASRMTPGSVSQLVAEMRRAASSRTPELPESGNQSAPESGAVAGIRQREGRMAEKTPKNGAFSHAPESGDAYARGTRYVSTNCTYVRNVTYKELPESGRYAVVELQRFLGERDLRHYGERYWYPIAARDPDRLLEHARWLLSLAATGKKFTRGRGAYAWFTWQKQFTGGSG